MIRGSTWDDTNGPPPTKYHAYTTIYNVLETMLAYSMPTLEKVVKENNEVWSDFLTRMSKAGNDGNVRHKEYDTNAT